MKDYCADFPERVCWFMYHGLYFERILYDITSTVSLLVMFCAMRFIFEIFCRGYSHKHTIIVTRSFY